MLPNPLPPLDELREAFRYNPDTGVLERRQFRYNKKLKKRVYYDRWSIVGTKHTSGYLVTSYLKLQIKIHRICWALHHNEDPYPLEIDHINRNKHDNAIRNLRRVTRKENCENSDDGNRHKHQKVRITYPDGRGVIVVDSIRTAAQVLNRAYSCIQQHLKRGNTNPLHWSIRDRRTSGILVCYEV